MNQAELIEVIARDAKITHFQALLVIYSITGAVKRELANDRVILLEKFGQFKRVTTQATSGRNPRTGAAIQIQAGKKAIFKASRLFKDELNTIA